MAPTNLRSLTDAQLDAARHKLDKDSAAAATQYKQDKLAIQAEQERRVVAARVEALSPAERDALAAALDEAEED